MAFNDRFHPWRSGARCVLFLSLCAIGSSVQANSDQLQRLQKLRKHISEMQVEMERTSESKTVAADALRQSERSISEINRKLKDLGLKLRIADRNFGKLKQQQQKLSATMENQTLVLNGLLYQRYVGRNREHLNLLLNHLDPNRVARELTYYRYVALDRSRQLADVHSDYLTLTEVTSEITKQRKELAEVRTEQAAEKEALRKQKLARKKTLAVISRQLRSQRREFKQMQNDENRLAKLVENISSMLESTQPTSLFRNDEYPDNRFDELSFDHLQGKLALPVKGVITNRFGAPRPESTLMWKGLFLRTSSAQAVKAVAAGQVVFADWLRGFGNLLIIDHGNGYMSLYGYNESLFKGVGDQVHGGDTIAETGNSGGNDEYGLYFELRHKSKPLDPIKWLSKR